MRWDFKVRSTRSLESIFVLAGAEVFFRYTSHYLVKEELSILVSQTINNKQKTFAFRPTNVTAWEAPPAPGSSLSSCHPDPHPASGHRESRRDVPLDHLPLSPLPCHSTSPLLQGINTLCSQEHTSYWNFILFQILNHMKHKFLIEWS